MARKILLASVAIFAIGGTAFAADLPSRSPPPVFVPPPPPIFSWTGFYVGAQIGIAFGRDAETFTSPAFPQFGSVSILDGRPNGLIGGGHVGYNFSTQGLGFGLGGGGLVLGIEGDIDGSDYRSSLAFDGVGSESFRSDIGGSLRGRIGVAAGRALFYATGGVALAEFQNVYASNAIVAGGSDNDTHSRVGYTVGGGIEYALTTTFSLRAEYRYTDYGHYSDVLAGSTLGLVAVEHHIVQNRAQVGFSYKFESPAAAPVVARY